MCFLPKVMNNYQNLQYIKCSCSLITDEKKNHDYTIFLRCTHVVKLKYNIILQNVVEIYKVAENGKQE